MVNRCCIVWFTPVKGVTQNGNSPAEGTLTFALVGGVGHFDHTTWLFANSRKTAARSAAVSGMPFHVSISHPYIKFQPTIVSGQATRPGQVTLPKKSWLRRDYSFKISIWNFQELIKVSAPTKCISLNFDLGDLRSGQFWDLTIIRQWENVQTPFFP